MEMFVNFAWLGILLHTWSDFADAKASKLSPTRSKGRKAIAGKSVEMDAVHFVNMDSFEKTLNSPVTDEGTKLWEMAVIFEELFDGGYYVTGTSWVLFSGIEYVVLSSSVIHEHISILNLTFHQLSSCSVLSLIVTVGIWYRPLKSLA